jgi:hypothetical protein
LAVAFRAASTAGYTAGASTLTGTEPAGTVATDVLVAQLIVQSTSGSTPTPPTGWTTLLSGLTAAGGASHFYYNVAWILRGGSAPSLAWTTGSTGVYRELNVLGFSGCDQTTPIDASQDGAPVNAANPDPPSVTAVNAACMAACFGAQWSGSTTSWTAPAGYTRRSRNTAGDDSAIATKLLSASGAENPAAWSGGAGTNDCWSATITLAPPAVASSIPPFLLMPPRLSS